jgi:hypothetical protein
MKSLEPYRSKRSQEKAANTNKQQHKEEDRERTLEIVQEALVLDELGTQVVQLGHTQRGRLHDIGMRVLSLRPDQERKKERRKERKKERKNHTLLRRIKKITIE